MKTINNKQIKWTQPKLLILIFISLAILMVVSALFELYQSKKELYGLMEKQARSLMESIIISSKNSLLTNERISALTEERLLNNAVLINTLFEDNISHIELEANELVDDLCSYKKSNDDQNSFFPVLEKGWLPSEFVKARFPRNHHDIINELKKQKLLEGLAIPKWNGAKKMSSYKMTKKFIDLFTEGQKELEELNN